MRQAANLQTRMEVLDELRNLARTLPPGSRLPTVRELSSQSGMSQHSIQRILTKLRAEGLITAHVGRGTFVGGQPTGDAAKTSARSVLTLLYQTRYERGDIIAQIIHHQLTTELHKSLILTYNDADHVCAMLRAGPRYDGCILQPRTSIVPVSLLSVLREIGGFAIVESRAFEQVDVDAISLDPATWCQTVLQHLTHLGHRRIAWVIEDRGDYLFERTASLFTSFRLWYGLSEVEAPLIWAPQRPRQFGFADLSATLGELFNPSRRVTPTAIVLLTFETGIGILSAFERIGRSIPKDVSIVRIGSPDLESEHLNKIAIAGRPSRQAAETVLRRLHWRWQNPDAPFGTIYDPPEFNPHSSTGPPSDF
jgi:DNA-binding LacI/PurR family transcriptional regulator